MGGPEKLSEEYQQKCRHIELESVVKYSVGEKNCFASRHSPPFYISQGV
jgi:hypothetical protein